MASDSRYVVVDTNVLVYMIADTPLAGQFASYLVGRIGILSFQSMAELLVIARRRGWGPQRRQRLNEQFERMIMVTPDDRIIERWADLMYEQTIRGSRVLPADAWIAATAFVYGCPVLTNDRKDFERISGLTLLPPSG